LEPDVLVVRIEEWPGGDADLRRPIARLEIANRSGLAPVSDYEVTLRPAVGEPSRPAIVYGHVRDDGWLKLARAALRAVDPDGAFYTSPVTQVPADVLDLLATAVQSSEYGWFVVTDAEPAAGVRALSPSAIKDKGLDTLHLLPRETADKIGVEVPTRTATSRTFTANGPGGAAMQTLFDAVSDYVIHAITSDIDLAVASLGMLQKQTITVRSTIRAEYKGLTGGGIQFQGSAERADFQMAYGHAKKALTAATKVVGDVTLTFRFDPALDVDDPQFTQIHDVIKKLGMKSTTVTAEVAK
jgi:hypothetical protein